MVSKGRERGRATGGAVVKNPTKRKCDKVGGQKEYKGNCGGRHREGDGRQGSKAPGRLGNTGQDTLTLLLAPPTGAGGSNNRLRLSSKYFPLFIFALILCVFSSVQYICFNSFSSVFHIPCRGARRFVAPISSSFLTSFFFSRNVHVVPVVSSMMILRCIVHFTVLNVLYTWQRSISVAWCCHH